MAKSLCAKGDQSTRSHISFTVFFSLLLFTLTGLAPQGIEMARAGEEQPLFHDRFQSATPLFTLRFYSGRVESEHMSDPDHIYGNYVVVGDRDHPGHQSNMALYTLSADPDNASVCTGSCAAAWPPFLVNGPSAVSVPAGFPGEVSVIQRTDPDGFQVTLNGRPLYRYAPDQQPGDTKGHLSGGVWQLIIVSQVTSPPPSDIDPEDHDAWFRGLNAWRMPRPQIGACVNCHSPDAYDIARVGFTRDDIMRRAVGDGLGVAEGEAILGLVDIQRARYHMTGENSPFHPDHFRPLQPGNFPLEGDTPAERDLAFARNLRETHNLLIASERIDTLEQAQAARDELLNLDLNTVRVGIPFDRFSEDPHHGSERNTFHDWMPFAPHEVLREHNDVWYALQDAYIADPTPDNLRALILAINEYTSTCRFIRGTAEVDECEVDDGSPGDPGDPGPYGYGPSLEPRNHPPEAEVPRLTRRWNMFRYRNMLLLQHMMRDENLRTHEQGLETAGLMYYPDFHPSDEVYGTMDREDKYQLMQDLNDYTAVWETGEAVGRINWHFDRYDRSNDPQVPAAFASRLGHEVVFDSPLNNSHYQYGGCRDENQMQYKERCYWRVQHQGLRSPWFWMGLAQDPEFLYTRESLEYFHQTYQQVEDYRLHSMFGTFVTALHRSYRHDTRYRGAGNRTLYRSVRHLNDRLMYRSQMTHFNPIGWFGDLDDDRQAEFQLIGGNIGRMYLLLMQEEIQRLGEVFDRDDKDRSNRLLDRIEHNLLSCPNEASNRCIEAPEHQAATSALLENVRALLDDAEVINEWRHEDGSWIQLGSPEAEAARHVHGWHNRWRYSDTAIGAEPPPIPRREFAEDGSCTSGC